MTGARIEVSLDTRDASAAIGRLVALGANLTPLLKSLGDALTETTKSRLGSGSGPDGVRWAPLNPVYASMKRNGGILVEKGMASGLLGSVTYQVAGSNAVLVGSNKPYAAIHQFGGVIRPKAGGFLVFRLGAHLVRTKQVKIPARPYLGIGVAERVAIDDAVHIELERALRGGS